MNGLDYAYQAVKTVLVIGWDALVDFAYDHPAITAWVITCVIVVPGCIVFVH